MVPSAVRRVHRLGAAVGELLVDEIAHASSDHLRRLLVQLVEKAHQVCPYSNATRGNIDVALSVNGRALE